jgi:hypothetical protein
VITKNDASKHRTSEDEKEIAYFETVIDQQLKTRYEGAKLWIDVKQLPKMKVRQAITQMYGTGGWTVEFVSDQREGSSISLE